LSDLDRFFVFALDAVFAPVLAFFLDLPVDTSSEPVGDRRGLLILPRVSFVITVAAPSGNASCELDAAWGGTGLNWN